LASFLILRLSARCRRALSGSSKLSLRREEVMSRNQYDRQLYEAIQDLLDEKLDPDGHIDKIARQAISHGYGSLNSAQRAEYDALVGEARKRLGKRGGDGGR